MTHALEVIQSVQLRAQSTVNAKELLVHNSCEGKSTERFHAGLIDSLRVFVLAFELECEVVGQVATFVVSSKQPKCLGVVNLETPEVENTLNTEVTSVDVITKEEVPGLGGVATNFEELHEIVVLSVNIATNGDGSIHLEKVGLGAQKLSTLLNDPKSLLLGKTTFAVEMLLEELEIGFGMGLILEELLVGRLVHGRSLDICENARDPGQSRYSRADLRGIGSHIDPSFSRDKPGDNLKVLRAIFCDQSVVDDDGGVEAATTGGGSHEPLHTRSMVLT